MGIRSTDDGAMKFLYIVSSPHGGSTLLSLVLGMHPRAANLGEVSLMPKQLAMAEPCTCREPLAACAAWQPVFELLARRENVDLRTSPYGFFLGDAFKSRIGAGLIDTEYQTKRRMAVAKMRGAADTLALRLAPHRVLLRLLTLPSIRASVDNTIKLYEIAAEAWSRQVIVDTSKLPKKAVHLYLRDPGRVRILHLLRDGRAVLASRTRYMSTENAADRWVHYHNLAQPLLRRWVPDEHKMVLRYEEFATDPALHARRLCEWLGIEFVPEMLDVGGGRTHHSAGGNPARFSLSRGIRPPDERWRSDLGAEQLERFERIAGALNRQLGYS